MIISIDTKRAFDTTQHPIRTKTLKPGIEVNTQKPRVNILLTVKQWWFLLVFQFNTALASPSQCNNVRKIYKSYED